MKHTLQRIPLFAIVVAALAGQPAAPRASTIVTINSPYGKTTPVLAAIGTYQGSGQYILWQNKLTQECHFTRIGDPQGFIWPYFEIVTSDAATAKAGSFDDEVTIVSDAFETYCSNFGARRALGPPLSTGGFSVSGGEGRDYMENLRGSNTLDGEGGNDYLIGRDLFGGDGDDVLVSYAADDVENLRAGAGDDCIYDASGRAAYVFCGEGADSYSTGLTSEYMDSCEKPVPYCEIK